MQTDSDIIRAVIIFEEAYIDRKMISFYLFCFPLFGNLPKSMFSYKFDCRYEIFFF